MEVRQSREEHLFAALGIGEPRTHLLDVIRQVTVREHRSLGQPRRAARILQHGDVVDRDVHLGWVGRRCPNELPHEVDPHAGLHLRHQGRIRSLEFEGRQQVEREPQVLRNRRDDIVFNRKRVAHGFDATLEQEIGYHGEGASGVIPLMLDLPLYIQGVGHHRLRA